MAAFTQITLTPELAEMLGKATPIVKDAKSAINPFASWDGPLGRYYARLRRILIGKNKKDGTPKFTFIHTCLATCPDSGSSSAIPDTKYAGRPMRNTAYTGASEKRSSSEAWAALFVTLQAYDIKTDQFGMRPDPVTKAPTWHKEFWMQDMVDAINYINERQPALIIEVTRSADGKYTNCNPRQTVLDEVVARFAKPSLELSEEEIRQLELAEEATTLDEVMQEEKWPFSPETATTMVEATVVEADLRANTEVMFAEFGIAPLPFPLSALSLAEVKAVALAGLTNGQIAWPDLSHVSARLSGQSVATAAAASFGMTASTPTEAPQQENPQYELEEEAPALEEEEAPAVSKDDTLMKAQLYAGGLDRAKIKQAIYEHGGCELIDDPARPGAKKPKPFSAAQTDDDLRNWLVGLIVGTIEPKSVVIRKAPF